jgi:hypothetical protein
MDQSLWQKKIIYATEVSTKLTNIDLLQIHYSF